MRITTKELRTRVRDVLDCLDRGEEVTLTYRGVPRAKLVGLDREDAPATDPDEGAAFGMWKDRDDLEDVDAYVRGLRRGRSRADRY